MPHRRPNVDYLQRLARSHQECASQHISPTMHTVPYRTALDSDLASRLLRIVIVQRAQTSLPFQMMDSDLDSFLATYDTGIAAAPPACITVMTVAYCVYADPSRFRFRSHKIRLSVSVLGRGTTCIRTSVISNKNKHPILDPFSSPRFARENNKIKTNWWEEGNIGAQTPVQFSSVQFRSVHFRVHVVNARFGFGKHRGDEEER